MDNPGHYDEYPELTRADEMTPTTPSPIPDQAAGEREAFENWFSTSGFWNDAITGKAWTAACKWQREQLTAPTTGSAAECTCAVRLMPGQIGATHSQDCPVTHWCRAAFKASGENAQASPAGSAPKPVANLIGPDQRQALRVAIDLAESGGWLETRKTLLALLAASMGGDRT